MPKQKTKSLVAAIFLLAGSCIGAGMLGLPISSGLAGFVPSIFSFVFAWALMMFLALFVMEANLREGTNVSFVTLAQKNLGSFAGIVSWTFFLFLFYALGVAYISGSGSLLSVFIEKRFDLFVSPQILSPLFALFFGWVIYLGTNLVISFNRYLMAGLILFYAFLFFVSFPYVRGDLLVYSDASKAVFAIPVMVISFGFQNMIPSLNNYFGGNTRKLHQTIIAGSFLTLVVYLFWQIIVLGIVPVQGKFSIVSSIKNDYEGAQALILITKSALITLFSVGFAFFAIATSYLAQGLSLVDFWADGLKIKNPKKGRRFVLVLLAVGPPYVISVLFPNLFLKALGFGGGICAMILFGILPPLICLKGRQKTKTGYRVFGGAGFAYLMVFLSVCVVVIELMNELGYGVLL